MMAAMWIICITTDSDGYHTDMKFKRMFLDHFSPLKVSPQKTKFNIECLESLTVASSPVYTGGFPMSCQKLNDQKVITDMTTSKN